MLADEQVPAAVALNQAGWQVASIVGPALAGILIAASGPAAAYGVDAATYTIGFGAALALRPLPPDKAMVERGVQRSPPDSGSSATAGSCNRRSRSTSSR